MTCAGRGVSLEQRTHRPVMFQSVFVTWHFVGGVEDAAHRTDARNCAQTHRPVAFAAMWMSSHRHTSPLFFDLFNVPTKERLAAMRGTAPGRHTDLKCAPL